MEIIAGLITATAVVGLEHATRQGRLLPFYSTVLIVIALTYVLFAVMAGAPRTIVIESTIAAAFFAVAVTAARGKNLRKAVLLLAVGLAAHGVYDLIHHAIVSSPVVPAWWPVFCGVVDIALGGWVLVFLRRDAPMTHEAREPFRFP